MKNIAIFRIAFQPQGNAELSNFLMAEITSDPRKNIAIPTPFGVLSIMTTNKSVEEVESALITNFPTLKFQVFEVTPEGQSTSNSGGEHANHTMDQILDLIGQVGGVENLPEGARQRLNELTGGQ
jgi:hypothetical protein